MDGAEKGFKCLNCCHKQRTSKRPEPFMKEAVKWSYSTLFQFHGASSLDCKTDPMPKLVVLMSECEFLAYRACHKWTRGTAVFCSTFILSMCNMTNKF